MAFVRNRRRRRTRRDDINRYAAALSLIRDKKLRNVYNVVLNVRSVAVYSLLNKSDVDSDFLCTHATFIYGTVRTYNI